MLTGCSEPSNSGDNFAPVALSAYFCARSVLVAVLRTTSSVLAAKRDPDLGPARLNKLSGRDHRGVADEGDQIALASRF
jgi:hypothetical protein